MKRHKLDPISLIAGLLITGMGLFFLLPADLADLIDFFGGADDLAAWAWPVIFIAIGLLVILPALLRNSDQPQETAEALEGEVDQTR